MNQRISFWTLLFLAVLTLSLSCDELGNGTGNLSEIDEIEARLARLEAKEACISTFNEYLYYVDGEKFDDIFTTVFSDDAVVELQNFPPGTGVNTKLEGHEQIRPIYDAQKGISHRHHTVNISVNVSSDSYSAEISAYLFTVLNYMLTGGIYEASLEYIDNQWYITNLRISSTWGWTVPDEKDPFLDEAFGAGTLRDGRPVIYEEP